MVGILYGLYMHSFYLWFGFANWWYFTLCGVIGTALVPVAWAVAARPIMKLGREMATSEPLSARRRK